jgi:hypothetical protein
MASGDGEKKAPPNSSRGNTPEREFQNSMTLAS